MKQFNIKVKAKSPKEAHAIEQALEDNVLRATCLCVGLLKNVDEAERRRIMIYLADKFGL